MYGVMIGVFWKRESRSTIWRKCCLLTSQLFFCHFTSIVPAIPDQVYRLITIF
jgi:hypothetical protein